MVNDYVKNGVNGIILTGDIEKDIDNINHFSQDINYQELEKKCVRKFKKYNDMARCNGKNLINL